MCRLGAFGIVSIADTAEISFNDRRVSALRFLLASANGKVCIELPDTFRVTLESLAPVGGNRSSEVGRLRNRPIVEIGTRNEVLRLSRDYNAPYLCNRESEERHSL